MSWVAPLKGKYMEGFSFTSVGKEIEMILSSYDDKVVSVELKKMAKKLCGEKGNFSIVLLTSEGDAGVYRRCGDGSIELVKVRREDVDGKAMAVYCGDKCEMQGKIECVSIVKAEDSEHNNYWISVSVCRDRSTAILRRTGVAEISLEYVPSLFKVDSKSVISNIRKTFLRSDKSNIVGNEASILRELIGVPFMIDPISVRRKLVCGSKMEDRETEEQLSRFLEYVTDEQKRNEEQRKIFIKVIKRIAKSGKPDERCLELLQLDPVSGEKLERARYRIGAFIRNGNVFLQYTRKKMRSKTTGWYPMKFDTNLKGAHVLKSIKNMDGKVISDTLFCTQIENVNPRIICILKDMNGKKVVNGCVYDLRTIREKIGKTETLPKIPLIQPGIMGNWERSDKQYTKDQSSETVTKVKKKNKAVKKSVEKETASPLPVMVMMQSDERRETRKLYQKTREELLRESQIVSQDGPEQCLEEEKENETEGQNDQNVNDTVCNRNEVDDIVSINKVNDDHEKNNNNDIINNINVEMNSNTNNINDTSNMVNIVCAKETDGGDNEAGRAVHISDTSACDKRGEGDDECSLPASLQKSVERVQVNNIDYFNKDCDMNDGINATLKQNNNNIININNNDNNSNDNNNVIDIEDINTNRNESYETEMNISQINNKCLVTVKQLMDNKINIIVRIDKRLIEGKETVIDVVINDEKEEDIQPVNKDRGVSVIEKEDNNKKKNENKNSKEKGDNNDKLRDNIFLKYQNKNIKNNNKEKDNDKKETPIKKTINIYGKEYQEKSLWYSITQEKEYLKPPACIMRHINPLDKKKFRGIMRGCSEKTILNAWLNLPRCLEGKEKWVWGISDRREEKDTIGNAISQFYKGAYSKSFSMLTDIRTGEVNMREEDIMRLFPRMSDAWRIETLPTSSSEETTLIKTEEVKLILNGTSLPNGKATGFSGLSYEIVRAVSKGEEGHATLCKVFNHILNHPEDIPKQYFMARVTGILKPDGGTRPLCIQETILKVLNKIVTLKITSIVRDKLLPTQKCLARTEGQAAAREQVLEHIREGYECAIQFDFQNAFGTISRRKIVERLLYYNVETRVINYIITILNNQKIVYEQGEETKILELETGVPQGEPLSMVLFAIGIDALIEEFDSREGIKVTAYADDVVVTVRKEEMIRGTMEEFECRAREYGLKLNKMKTKLNLIKDISRENVKSIGISENNIINLNYGASTYVGLPLTLNRNLEMHFVREKVRELMSLTEKLWNSDTPVQLKYHLQRMCADTTLDYALKVIKYKKEDDNLWIKDMQEKFNGIWQKQIGPLPDKIWRLPVKYYGMGMLHIKDKWKLLNKLIETKSSEKEKTVLSFYKEKMEKWTQKRRIQKLDIERIPPTSNVSLSMPPESNATRLSNRAFKMLITLRYNGECEELRHIDDNGYMRCKNHNDKDVTLQHLISCSYTCGERTFEQHNRICHILRGILRRRKETSKVEIEKYSLTQLQNKENGEKSHRADLTYKVGNIPHSIDVTVTSSNNSNVRNNVSRAMNNKTWQYGKENNLHIVLLDTAGNITNDSWNYLLSIGATRKELRIIQKILFECTVRKVEEIIDMRKHQKN